jgi:hypothetical protein
VLRTRLPLALQFPKMPVRLTCVRHAASVHPEPGSNSPLNINVLSLHPRFSDSFASFFPTTLQLLRFALDRTGALIPHLCAHVKFWFLREQNRRLVLSAGDKERLSTKSYPNHVGFVSMSLRNWICNLPEHSHYINILFFVNSFEP